MSRSRFKYDAELAIRGYGEAAVTADGATNAFPLIRNVHRASAPRLAHQEVAIVIDVRAFESGAGDETYKLDVEFSEDEAFTTPIAFNSLTVKATGSYAFIVDTDTLEKLEAGAAFVRVKADVGGVAPSIEYAAYLSPNE